MAREESIPYFLLAGRANGTNQRPTSAMTSGEQGRDVNACAWDRILTTRSTLDASRAEAWAVPASFLAYLIES